MLQRLRKLIGAHPQAAAMLPAVPAGERIYAIGDIHGRLDLFEALIEAIEHDDRDAASPARSTVILLGDLVDRGPASAQVVARARAWQDQRAVRILAGNHEEMFLSAFDDIEVLRHYLKHGGRETLLSYGIDRDTYDEATIEQVRHLMEAAVPQQDRDFIAAFESAVVIGDYLFVHAGIRPQVPFDQQERRDMRWIREPFLRFAGPHPFMVVHGHTISQTADVQPNRIGIDTGAFRTGVLTALVLEGTGRRFIQAVADDGQTTILREYAST